MPKFQITYIYPPITTSKIRIINVTREGNYDTQTTYDLAKRASYYARATRGQVMPKKSAKLDHAG